MKFYDAFIEETEPLFPMSVDTPVTTVVAELTRAAKRAELVVEGVIPRVKDRKK